MCVSRRGCGVKILLGAGASATSVSDTWGAADGIFSRIRAAKALGPAFRVILGAGVTGH